MGIPIRVTAERRLLVQCRPAAAAVMAPASKRGSDPETPGGHAVAPGFVDIISRVPKPLHRAWVWA